MKMNNINKLNYINQMLISINHNNFSLILIICYLIISNYYINILIFLITFLLLKVILNNNNNINSNTSIIKIILISIFIYYLIYIYLICNVIYMDSTEYLILYNNIYIKGLNSLVENYGELIPYVLGVTFSSIYLKICPIEPTFYFNYPFENLVFNISYIFYLFFIRIYFIFLIIKFINFIKFIIFLKRI